MPVQEGKRSIPGQLGGWGVVSVGAVLLKESMPPNCPFQPRRDANRHARLTPNY